MWRLPHCGVGLGRPLFAREQATACVGIDRLSMMPSVNANAGRIIEVVSPGDLAAVRRLFEEYAASLKVDLCFQGFAAELAGLPGDYAAPRGRLLLATIDGTPAGCVALRPKGDRRCEMKRLYVSPARQGCGLGRRLAGHVIAEARSLGYASVLLDTLPSMAAAQKLYASLGFVPCAPYYPTPVGGTVFMELRLL